MKRHIFAALIALAVTVPTVSKADTSYTLLVNTTDGNTVEYDFENLPIATFEGDVMIITDNRNPDCTRFEMDNVVNMTFKSSDSGVDEITEASNVRISVTDGCLNISGLKPGVRITVYHASGNAIISDVADQYESVAVGISHLGKGIYVVSAPGCSFKFIR